MRRTTLVTGGFGFIGAHLLNRLVADGWDVLVIDREPVNNAADEVLTDRTRSSVRFVGTTIPATPDLTALLKGFGVELIVHLASPLATTTEGQPGVAVENMIIPHLAVLESASAAQVRRVVWASSVGVFGRTEDYPSLPISNEAIHRPLTLYGAAKSFMERLAARFTAECGLDTIGLRFPLVYGPARRRGSGQFTTRLIEDVALGLPTVVPDGDARYDWMYVTDAARSIELALKSSTTRSKALTVGGSTATVRDVADLLHGWFPEVPLEVLDGANELVADYDPGPAMVELGYVPTISLSDGILATANDARRRAGLVEIN